MSEPSGRSLVPAYDKKALEAQEDARLAVYASRASRAVRRYPLAEEGKTYDYRTEYQRDRDRIIHSRAFRRLKHKTQVFIPFEGDHYRTRLTHTLEVTQIARTVARALGLNEDLAEACALGHDLGHTPFGHSGEKVLNRILTGAEPSFPLDAKLAEQVGAFKHNYQAVRVVDVLEKRYEHPGLNLTNDTREGILKHTTWRRDFPFPDVDAEGLNLSSGGHLEGQAVAWADEYAQQAHDLEDGLKLVDFEKVLALAGRARRRRGARSRVDARDGPHGARGDADPRDDPSPRHGPHHVLARLHRQVARGEIREDAGRLLRAAAQAPGLPRRAVEDGAALLRRAEGVHLPAHHPQPPRRAARRARAARRHLALRGVVPATRASCPTTSSCATATSRA